MSMSEWAKREVEIACDRERKNAEGDDWNYGVACYESALKAFSSLMEDGHSGYSIGITKHILNRLIDGKPLTPIEDTEGVWNDHTCEEFNYKSYQCNRMSALFKDVYDDGTVKYSDVNRVECYNINDPNVCWCNGFIRNLIDDMFPITMPYNPPSNPFKVYICELLTDRKYGDFDTMVVLYVVKPDGERVDINRYFKEDTHSFVEIDVSEYHDRLIKHTNRIEKEKENVKD